MSRKGAFLAAAFCVALFFPPSSFAKTNSYFYQPQFMAKVEDAANRLNFLSPHFFPGNRWGMPNAKNSTYTLNHVSQTTLGINIFFTENGVEEKQQGLLGPTREVPYKRDLVISIVYADLQSLRIWNIDRTSAWCVVPVGGRAEQNAVLCMLSFKDAQEVVDALATLAVACGTDLRSSFSMMVQLTPEKDVRKHPEMAGCEVMDVDLNGPAAQAGVRKDDILKTINGAPCTAEAIRAAIAEATAKPDGGVLRAEVLRKEVSIVLDLRYPHVAVDVAGLRQQMADLSKPASAAPAAAPVAAAPAFRLGVSIRAIADADLPALMLPKAKGVLVTKVEKDTLADEMQMQVGDAIIEVNGTEIADPSAFAPLVRGGAARSFKVWRKGQALNLVVPESL